EYGIAGLTAHHGALRQMALLAILAGQHQFKIDFGDGKRQHPLCFPATVFALELISERSGTVYLQDRGHVSDPWPAPINRIFHVLKRFDESHQTDDVVRLKGDQATVS
ncbi:MAG: hypothetical protein O7G86_18595, partial [Gammaproteobacteria bacterium]|nr:hypothetical protein [Gammaproteobacteria bacterium]